MEAPRFIELEGVHNFRDLGGYVMAGGARMKSGMLWRSGQHHDATESDLAVIGSLGLKHVFDLRGDRERKVHPCRRPSGFSGSVHCVSDGSAERAPHVSAALRDPESTRQSMLRAYDGMPYRPTIGEAVSGYIAIVASGGGASLINCAAGKDRTGFAVAMLHHALGVHPDDIMADYLLTNIAGDQAARLQAGRKMVAQLSGKIDDESLKIVMGVAPEYLETAYARLREDFGSIDAYLEQRLGVTPALREILRESLAE